MDFQAQSIKAMAELLAEHVPELKSDHDCRSWLEAAGFPNWTIHQHLNDAREMARAIRVQECERLLANYWRGR